MANVPATPYITLEQANAAIEYLFEAYAKERGPVALGLHGALSALLDARWAMENDPTTPTVFANLQVNRR